MEIYVHKQGKAEMHLAATAEGTTVADLARDHGVESDSVWLGDSDEPLALEATLEAAGVGDRDHVHIGSCRRVAIGVRYGGDTKSRKFPPGVTVHRVFKWATGPKGFGLTASERAKHTVAVCGSDVEVDRDAHIGSLATECQLCLDLAPKVRFEG